MSMDPYEVQYVDEHGNAASTSIDGSLGYAKAHARHLVSHNVKGVVLYERVIALQRIDYEKEKS